MRLVIAMAIVLLFVAGTAGAGDPTPSGTAGAGGPASCGQFGELAAEIMKAHQNGLPLAKVMGIAKNADGAPDAFTRKMILAAYETTRWHSEESKQRAIEDFRNAVTLACYKSGGE